jgi:hypothetical protein
MNNKYPGTCYECGVHIEAGEGYFERYRGRWWTRCIKCTTLDKIKKDYPLSWKQNDWYKKYQEEIKTGV